MKGRVILAVAVLSTVLTAGSFGGRAGPEAGLAADGTVDEVVISASLVDMRTGTATSSLLLHEGETVPIAYDVETFNDSDITVKKKMQAVQTVAPRTRLHCTINGNLTDNQIQLQNGSKKNPHDWVPTDRWPAKACSVGFLVGLLETCAPGFVDGEGGSHAVQVSKDIPFGKAQVHECKHWLGKSTNVGGLAGADIDRCSVTEPGAAIYKTLAGRRCVFDRIKSGEDPPGETTTHRVGGIEITALPGSAGTYVMEAGVVVEVEEAVDSNPANNVLGFTYEIVICEDSDGDTTCDIDVGGTGEVLVEGWDAPGSAAAGSGSSSPPYAAIAGIAAAAAVALAASGWYARRRWLR